MRFQLPHPKFDPKIFAILKRAIQQQHIRVVKTTQKHLKELAKIDQEIRKRKIPKFLVLRKLPYNLGKGIFLHPKAKFIQKGTFIGSYSGKTSLVPQNAFNDSDYIFSLIGDMQLTKEEQKLIDPHNRYHPRRYYSFEVDAEKTGNFTRFINHSQKPNLEAQYVWIPKNSYGIEETPIEVIYVAKKTIHPGEQLLVNYEEDGDSYWAALGIQPLPIYPDTFTLSNVLKVQK